MVRKIYQGQICSVVILSVLFSAFPKSHSDIYTSSKKIEDMVLQEEKLLNNLQTEMTNSADSSTLSYFKQFYADRIMKFQHRMSDERIHDILKHPNGVYRSIKEFTNDYQGLRIALGPSPSANIQQQLSAVATTNDILGARRSLLRLEQVYSLKPIDMARGDYLGFSGPSLNSLDAFEVGQSAFVGGQMNSTISWLDVALALKKNSAPGVTRDKPVEVQPSDAQIFALQGRAYLRLSHDQEASALYEKAQNLDPSNGDVLQLGQEISLEPKPRLPDIQLVDLDNENFNRLCTIESKSISGKFDPRLKCYYRRATISYYRVKQELLSVSPYVCLFYDVITDAEGQYMKEFVITKLRRGLMEMRTGSVEGEGRTSDLSFVWDHDSKVFRDVSRRVGDITYLDTSQNPLGSPFSGEPFQVVNYGVGGHYGVHMDTFDEAEQVYTKDIMTHCGNRLATFLIYLSDVEKGGATAFPRADIVVRPVKNMALFWYSSNPAGEIDNKTLHAGCPVVIGHKWVTNKWIWTLGNSFARRCGLREDATQLDIEDDMRRRWK